MAKLFGTDGVRGIANEELTPELAVALGRAAAHVLASGRSVPKVVVGRDTRASGDMLASALAAGVLSAGANVIRGRVLPTPAVAFLVTHLQACAGAVISASHNPAEDNGIKFFDADGFKLSEETEEEIEKLLESEVKRLTGKGVGRLEFVPDADERYVSHALEALEGRALDGLKIVLDCAHGAAYRTTPDAFRSAGAEVAVIGDDPDGLNINQGVGSLSTDALAREVVSRKANLGLAHDGDADRAIAVDENGDILDGDKMLAALAIELKDRGRLAKDTVVTTVMANLGFHRAMDAAGIKVVETPVGDRFVIEAMRRDGAVLGGEQSGHIIFTDWCTTGDGLITGLRLAGLLASSGKKLSEIGSVVTKYPQVLLNVKVARKDGLAENAGIWKAVNEAADRLGPDGRVLVRPSGTEPLVRVMVEARDESEAGEIASTLAEIVHDELEGLPASG